MEKPIVTISAEFNDYDLESCLRKLKIKIQNDGSGEDGFIYGGQLYRANIDKFYDSPGYCAKVLGSMGFRVTKNSYGDLKVYSGNITEKADKNTNAGNYQTKSNKYDPKEVKKSKLLDLSVGDVVVLNPQAAFSPIPGKSATGLYAVVTKIKSNDSVSVEAENGSVYNISNKNQFAKVKGMKEGLEPHTGPKWDADIKQRATFYVGQDKYDAHEILQLMAKEYQTTPEEISRITGLKEDFRSDQIKAKVKADAKARDRGALGNMAKGLVTKSPAIDYTAQRVLGVRSDADKERDEDYYYGEGNKVRLQPNVSESVKGDIGIIRSVVGKHIMVEIEGQGIIPVLRSDIKEAYAGIDDAWFRAYPGFVTLVDDIGIPESPEDEEAFFAEVQDRLPDIPLRILKIYLDRYLHEDDDLPYGREDMPPPGFQEAFREASKLPGFDTKARGANWALVQKPNGNLGLFLNMPQNQAIALKKRVLQSLGIKDFKQVGGKWCKDEVVKNGLKKSMLPSHWEFPMDVSLQLMEILTSLPKKMGGMGKEYTQLNKELGQMAPGTPGGVADPDWSDMKEDRRVREAVGDSKPIDYNDPDEKAYRKASLRAWNNGEDMIGITDEDRVDDENWNAFDKPTGDDPEELASFDAWDKEHGLNAEDEVNDGIVDNIVDAVSRRSGVSYETILDNYPYEEILDTFEMFDQDTDATIDSLVDQIMNYGEEPAMNDYGAPSNNMDTIHSDNPLIGNQDPISYDTDWPEDLDPDTGLPWDEEDY